MSSGTVVEEVALLTPAGWSQPATHAKATSAKLAKNVAMIFTTELSIDEAGESRPLKTQGLRDESLSGILATLFRLVVSELTEIAGDGGADLQSFFQNAKDLR